MSSKARSIVSLIVLALCAPFALAQDGSQAQQPPPPPQQGQGQVWPWRPVGPDGQMGRGGVRRQPMMFDDRGEPMNDMQGPMRRGMGRGMEFGGRGRGMHPGEPMPLARIVNNPDMREKLGITPDQAAKIRQQDADFQKAGIMNRAKLEVGHLELRQLMSADKPDRAAIDRKLSEISTAQLTAEQTRVHHQLDMKTALTAGQQATLRELMQARRGGMRGPGNMQGPGRGGRGRPMPPQGTGTGTPTDPTEGGKL